MRMCREDEQPVGEKTVSLAQGEVQMGFSAGGVLLANEEVEPIVSLRQLITIQCLCSRKGWAPLALSIVGGAGQQSVPRV